MIAELLAFAAVGLATGLLSGTLGVGGGFILVPLLTLIGVPIHEAVGTSLAFIVLVSSAGAARHLYQSSPTRGSPAPSPSRAWSPHSSGRAWRTASTRTHSRWSLG